MRFFGVKTAFAFGMGIAFTFGGAPAAAQESGVDSARAKASGAKTSAEAALAAGQTLRRAGREAEALTELRRGLGLSGGQADITGRLQWEVARAQVQRR